MSEAETDKKIMSKAQRRKEKKNEAPATQSEKDEAREKLKALRKEMRMMKSNGSRRKVRLHAATKRERENEENDEPRFEDERPRNKRRVE